MEQIHFHRLFQEIGTKLICPQCRQKISPLALSLKDSSQNTCLFEAECEYCGNTAHISAVVETQLTEEGQKMNASSRIQNTLIHTPITITELENLKSSLQTPSSLDLLFQKNNFII